MESLKKRYKNKKFNPIIMCFIAILVCVVFLSYGFSAYYSNLSFSDISAMIRLQKDIRITNFMKSTVTSSASSSNENFNYDNASANINLPNSDSTVTYIVDITNIGNVEAALTSITGLPNNLTYTLSGYHINDLLCDNNNSSKCKLGSTTTISLTIGYAENGYDSTDTNYNIDMDFDFLYIDDAIAIMDNRLYATLQGAINNVRTNNQQKTVVLLNDTSEIITIGRNKNIILDLNNNTLSNYENNPVISNNGTTQIINGTVTSDAAKNGAINNEQYGVITINNRIIATGGRQALYNNNGVATISGNAYLSAVTTERASVQNLSGGTLTITGGTIISTGSNGIQNEGTMTIGVKDNNINRNSLLIQGEANGIYSTVNFNFYDGTAKGKTIAIDSTSKVADVETGYNVVTTGETISGSLYSVSYLGNGYTVTFDPDGGSINETTRYVEANDILGPLPIPTKTNHVFIGWFTQGGTEISSSTTITDNVGYIAHWTESLYAASIGDTNFETLQLAVDSVPTDNVKVVIKVLKNIDSENIIVAANKNIEFDLQNFTVSNTSGILIDNSGTIEIKNGLFLRNGANDEKRVIKNESSGVITISGGEIKSNIHQAIQNYGTINITGGKIWISTSADQGVINNENRAVLTVSGGQIIGTKRQAIYNNGGTLTISGSANMSNGDGVTANRACVQNVTGTVTISGGTITSPSTAYPAVLNNSTMIITGGTITSTGYYGVNNIGGTLRIGTEDGIIDTSTPTIVGYTIGVNNTATLKFYDGTLKGINKSYNGTISDREDNSQIIEGTEVINNNTYKTAHLEF